MNEIFMWFWIADIATGLQVVSLVLVALLLTVGLMFFFNGDFYMPGDKIDPEVKKWGKRSGAAVGILLFIGIVTPSPTTIRVFAVGKVAEVAATETNLGKKTVEALEAVLDKIIKEEKK